MSSVDAAEQSSQFEFNENSNLTQMIDPTGLNYEYTYDDKGNITCATSSSGQKIQITYDDYSNPTQTTTSDEAGENKIITSAGYSQDGERTTSNTDSRGNTETYTYEDNNAAEGKYLRLSSTTLDGISTSYSYDNVTDRLTKIEQGSASVQYGYNLDGSLHFILQGGYAYTFTYDGFGRTTRVGVAERNLVNNQYDSLGRLSLVTYGNGHQAQYTYDSKDQVTSIYTTGDKSQTVNYSYDAKGQIIDKTVSNDKETVSYAYLYDILGRITSTYGNNGHSLAVEYDGKNRVVTLSNTVGGTGFKTTYTYNDQKGIIEKVSSSKGSEIFEKSYTLDSLGRIEEYLYNTSNGYKVEFTYHNGSIEGTTTTLVKTMKVGANTFEYSYDNRGNITRITKNGSEIQSYVYDSLNQLTRENNAETNETVVFSYDNHGNILNKKIYAHTLDANLSGKTCQTIYYGYDNVWTDLLIRYKGQTITYDRIGNPLKYRDGFSFGWSGGRKLTTVSLNNGSVYMTAEYRYDDNGIRTYKSVNGNVTKYYLNGSTILSEITNYGGVTRRIDYVYDENGSIYGFSVNCKSYYYQKNLQGDITGILDSNGVLLVEYIYDAYGVPTTRFTGITDSLSDAEKQEIYILGSNNPFRYRGYYYDTETGFYYLNSRYYDPTTGRFLNADGVVSGTGDSVQGYNLFAYCFNNPINASDEGGNWPKWVKSVASAITKVAKEIVSVVTEVAKAITAPLTLVNHIQQAHVTTPTAMIDMGVLFGKVGFSSTVTKQDKEPGLVHSTADIGNDASKYSAGVNIAGLLGADIGVSSEINAFGSVQLTPWFHAEGSIGLDGLGAVIGFDIGDISYDFEINAGLGLILIFVAPHLIGTGGVPSGAPA